MTRKDPSYFYFKHFRLRNKSAGFKVNTDGVLLGAWTNIIDGETVLDIGTGTGVIPLMLAQKSDSARITAVEIQKASYEEALFNFKLNKRDIALHHCDIQEFAKSVETYDHIVSNPPYFQNDTNTLNKGLNLSKHSLTLDFEGFWHAIEKLSHNNTRVSVIIPFDELDKFVVLAKARTFYLFRLCYIKSRPHLPLIRVLIEFTRHEDDNPSIEEMHLLDEGRNNWSKRYRELTKEFYLDA